MATRTISQGQFPQPGELIVSGKASSGRCDDSNGCTVETMATPTKATTLEQDAQIPVYQPQPSSYDRTVVPVVLPDSPWNTQPQEPAQSEVPMASRMLGIERPSPVSGPQCTPAQQATGQCNPTRPMQGYSRQILGLPNQVTNFGPLDNTDQDAAARRMFASRSLLRSIGELPDDALASTVAASSGQAAARARQLREQGLDWATADAQARREFAEQTGNQTAFTQTGVLPQLTRRIEQTGRQEIDTGFNLGAPTPALMQLAASGQIPGLRYTSDGRLVQATGAGTSIPVQMTPEAARDPLAVSQSMSGTGTVAQGIQTSRATALKNQQALNLERQRAAARTADIALRDTLRATRPAAGSTAAPKGFAALSPAQQAVVQRSWEASGRRFRGLPITLEGFYNAQAMASRRDDYEGLPAADEEDGL